MTIAVMQPCFMPSIGYYQLLNSVDRFIILDTVSFSTRGWINRNRILINHEEFLFTLPIEKMSQNKQIADTRLSDTGWRRKLLRTIQFSYGRAPYFDDVFPLMEEIISYDSNKVSEFITHSLQKTCAFLDITTPLVIDSEACGENTPQGEERIVNICKREGADRYINPAGEKKLFTNERFKEEGIKLFFLKPDDIWYKQFDDFFVPWLSMIDILMFNSVVTIEEFLEAHTITSYHNFKDEEE